jgi:hypothetical protein
LRSCARAGNRAGLFHARQATAGRSVEQFSTSAVSPPNSIVIGLLFTMAVGAPPPAGEGISMHPSSHSARHSRAGTRSAPPRRWPAQRNVEQISTSRASRPGRGRSPIDLNNGRTAAAAPREKKFLRTPPAWPRLRGVAPVALSKNFRRPHVPRAAVARRGASHRRRCRKNFGRPHVPEAAPPKSGTKRRRPYRKSLDDPMYREPSGSSQRLTAPSRSAGGRRGAAS